MRVINVLRFVINRDGLVDRQEAELAVGPVPVLRAVRGDVDRRLHLLGCHVAVGEVPIRAALFVVPVRRSGIIQTFEEVEVQAVGDRLYAVFVLQRRKRLAAHEVLILRRQVFFLGHLEVELRLGEGDYRN